MRKFGSITEILDFAIGEEESARKFYEGLSRKSQSAAMREVFSGFAREESGHKAKLEAIKKGRLDAKLEACVKDLKIGDYLVDVEPSPDLNYQEALILAMKKEKVAFRMYSELAEVAGAGELRDIFLSLAQEEARHKLRFEIEYDDKIMTDN